MAIGSHQVSANSTFVGRLRETIGIPAAVTMIGAAVAACFAQRFSVSIECAQVLAFPFIAVAFVRLFKDRSLRLPAPLGLLAVGGWFFATLNIYGYLPSFSERPIVYLSRLDNDPEEKLARELLLRYTTISKAYSLPRMELVLRRFADNALAQSWLNDRQTSSLLISGDPNWLTVTFPSKVLSIGELEDKARPELMQLLHAEAKRLDVDLETRVRVAVIPGLDVPMAFALAPDEIVVPGEPTELARHYLGWLARALGRTSGSYQDIGDAKRGIGSSPRFDELERFAYHADAVAQTTMMLGAWRSPEPIACARFLMGTVRLFEALSEPSSMSEAIEDSINIFNSSQKILRKESQPALVSLIRTNAVLATLLSNNDEEDLSRLRRDLINTASITDSSGHPTRGARLALLNLEVLEYAGVL
ncbi:MAG: hypothetical protein U0136_10255 [Bdellovibrionota bacterium]